MYKRQKQNKSVSVFLFLAIVTIFDTSCGTSERQEDWSYDKVVNQKAVISVDNYSKWRPLWDGRSWNIALEKKFENLSETKSNLAKKIVNKFALGESQSDKTVQNLAFFLQSKMNLQQLVLKKDVKTYPVYLNKKVEGFLFLNIANATDNLNYIFKKLHPKEVISGSKVFENSLLALESLDGVAWAEPSLNNQVFQSTYTPLPELSNPLVANVFSKLKANSAYQFAFNNKLLDSENRRQVVVAVLDTGIDFAHPKLKNQMFENLIEKNGQVGVDDDGNGIVDDIVGFDASIEPEQGDLLGDPIPGAADIGGPGQECPLNDIVSVHNSCGHGTHVAGLVAAKSTGDGPIGVCQDCKLYSLRSVSRQVVDGVQIDTGITDRAQIRALSYVLNFTDPNTDALNIHVVNMSIGKYFRSRSIAFLIQSLSKNGVLVVAAAGNEGTETPSYPAAYSSVLSVCALSTAITDASSGLRRTGEFAIAPFSNFGQWIDICAPGTDILSTLPGNKDGKDSGTSMASPIVAGAAGYLLSLDKNLTNEGARRLLLDFANADDVYKNEANNKYFFGEFKHGGGYYYLGKGALDLENSVKALVGIGVKNDFISATEFKPQIKEGCVISSVAQNQNPSMWSILSSIPTLLAIFFIFIKIRSASTRRRR